MNILRIHWQSAEHSGDIIKQIPHCPSRHFTPTRKERHGVTSCKAVKQRSMHFSGPSFCANWWASIQRNEFPVPKATKISTLNLYAAFTANTTTSVSTERIRTDLKLSWVIVSFTWTNILMSASSWLHGWRNSLFLSRNVKMCSSTVATTVLPASRKFLCMKSDKKWNNLDLFWSFLKNEPHLTGISVEPSTLRLFPAPRFSLVAGFKLCGR